LIGQYQSKTWQATLEAIGSLDPAAGIGLAFRYDSNSPFSGVHDPHLDALLAQAAATINVPARRRLYADAAAYIAKEAYSPFLFPLNSYDIATPGVGGPGLSVPIPATVGAEILWQDVYNNG
jgi:peptide/nickel transport system substrate-binding protein